MKNAAIALLVIIVAVLGYLQFLNISSVDKSNNQTPYVAGGSSQNKENAINLANKGLTEFPKSVLETSTATTLDVSHNRLTGALPAEIRKLTNLETLLASDNNLTGIPAEIGQLRDLKVVDFSNNNISGIPIEIGNLKNLQTLDLRGNPHASSQDIMKIRQKIPNATILTD